MILPQPLGSAHTHTGWLSWMLIPALGVGAYTILLSWVASTESRPGAFQSRNILTFLLLTVPASSLSHHLSDAHHRAPSIHQLCRRTDTLLSLDVLWAESVKNLQARFCL